MEQTDPFNGRISRVTLIPKPRVMMLCLDGELVPYHTARESGTTYDISEAVDTAAEDAVTEGARYAFARCATRAGVSYEDCGDVVHEWSNKDQGNLPPWLMRPGMPRSLLVIRTDEEPHLESWSTYDGVKLSLEWLIKKGYPHHWHLTAYQWRDDTDTHYIEIGQSTLGEAADSLMARVMGIVERRTANAQA